MPIAERTKSQDLHTNMCLYGGKAILRLQERRDNEPERERERERESTQDMG